MRKLEVVDLQENEQWDHSLTAQKTVINQGSINTTNVLLIFNLDVQHLQQITLKKKKKKGRIDRKERKGNKPTKSQI